MNNGQPRNQTNTQLTTTKPAIRATPMEQRMVLDCIREQNENCGSLRAQRLQWEGDEPTTRFPTDISYLLNDGNRGINDEA